MQLPLLVQHWGRPPWALLQSSWRPLAQEQHRFSCPQECLPLGQVWHTAAAEKGLRAPTPASAPVVEAGAEGKEGKRGRKPSDSHLPIETSGPDVHAFP